MFLRSARKLGASQRGFTLVEVTVALAIMGLVVGGLGGSLWLVLRVPEEQQARLQLQQQLRAASEWVRLDANKAQSFQAGTPPTYGTFRWLDFSTFPPTRRKVVYFYQESDTVNPAATEAPFNYLVFYRQPYTEGVPEPPIPLLRRLAQPDDVTFTVQENPHPLNNTATERVLTVAMTVTTDAGALGTLQESATAGAELRPEQLKPLEYRFYFLHNNPTPPTGDTNAQALLPTDLVKPTATTLYNYDKDRDSYPGLRLLRGPAGGKLDSPDLTKNQDWRSAPLPEAVTVDGRVSLYLPLAASAFSTDKLLTLRAWLLDYDPATGESILIIKEETASFTSKNGWSEVSIHFRPTAYTFAAGREIALRIQFDGQSEADGMVAYDTVNQLALLSIPTVP